MPVSAASQRARRAYRARQSFNAELRGARRVKRLFRALPTAFGGQMATALERAGRLLQAAMQARSPKKTQALAAGLVFRVLPKTLRMRVGLLGTPNGRSKLFYGRIQDLGRKAQTVTVTRHVTGRGRYLLKGRERVHDFSKYTMRVRAMAPKRFITGRFPELRRVIGQEIKGIFARALQAIGAGDD